MNYGLSFAFGVNMFEIVTRSMCSAAQELTYEELEDLLPHCSSGTNCLK